MGKRVSRRAFLKGAAAGIGACGAGILPFGSTVGAQSEISRSKVAIVYSPDVFVDPDANSNIAQDLGMSAVGAADNSIDQVVLNSMLDRGLQALTGVRADFAWKSLFKPTDVVGIKINCLFGRGVSTTPEVVTAVIAGLQTAGVKDENIIVWDWKDQHLIGGGYRINRDEPGVRCYGTEDDFDESPTRVGQFNGRMSRILTEEITALVNVPILKDHGNSGVTCAMKNHYGSHNNPRDHHANNCNPYIAELNSVPAIRDKTRLIVCDALKPLANGGPGMNREFIWEYRSLLVSSDPVALDYQGWRIIDARRKEVGIQSLAESGREPVWIATAASMGLGTDDPSRMQVIRRTVRA